MITGVDQSSLNSLGTTSGSSASSSTSGDFASLLSSQVAQMQSAIYQSLASGGTTQVNATAMQDQFTLQDLNYMANMALVQQNMPAYATAEAGINVAKQVVGQLSNASFTTSSTAGSTIASNASPSAQYLSYEQGDTAVNSLGTYDSEVQTGGLTYNG